MLTRSPNLAQIPYPQPETQSCTNLLLTLTVNCVFQHPNHHITSPQYFFQVKNVVKTLCVNWELIKYMGGLAEVIGLEP